MMKMKTFTAITSPLPPNLGLMMHGFLRYSHRNRALAFARFHRLSLPKKATISERSNHTIIDESPNINPTSAKNPENSSISPIAEEEITDLQNNEDTASEIVNNSVFSLVTDLKLIDKLDSEEAGIILHWK